MEWNNRNNGKRKKTSAEIHSRLSKLNESFINEEKEKWNKSLRQKSEKKEFKCTACDRIFSRYQHLLRHVERHWSQRSYHSCDICGKTFTRKDTMQSHKRELHSENNYECTMCPKKCGTQRQLNKHIKTHMRTKIPKIPKKEEGKEEEEEGTPTVLMESNK